MRRLWLSVFFAAAGCTIEAGGMAGKTCSTASDCPPELVCVEARPGAGRTCEALALPGTGQSPDGGAPDAGPGPVALWCGDVEPLMQVYCAECHGEDRSKSMQPTFRLDIYEDANGLKGARTLAPRIKARMVDFPTMPPFDYPAQPTDAERALVEAWVLSGAPECAPDGGMSLPDSDM